MFNISDTVSLVRKKKACGILIKKPSNIFYATNFSGEGYVYFTDKGKIFLYVDGRYSERASKECYEYVNVVKIKDIYKDIAADILNMILKDGGGNSRNDRDRRKGDAGCDMRLYDKRTKNIPTLMFESDYLTCDEYAEFKEKFKNKINLIAAGGIISRMRTVKDEGELNYIIGAIKIAEESMIKALKAFYRKSFKTSFGVLTEKDLALNYKKNLIERGSKESFETITLFGKNSSLPHGMPSDEKISNSGVILCDFGAEKNGYKSDETITFYLGKPDGKFLEVYDIVYSAQQKAISKIKPGVKFSVLDKIARDYIDKRGYGKYFSHSLGHGVGLEIHEYPYISKKNDDTVKEGMVFTIEPGVYIEGEFGIRIEDMCYVEKDGARIITNIKKNDCNFNLLL